MLKKILLGLVVAVVALAGYIASRPAHFSLQRTATIPAPPEVAFALVNDFHYWNQWSPWDKLDPNQKTAFDGAPAGTGAKYSWVGNDDVGEGRMTIEESKPNELVRIKLEFIKPFEATNTTTFHFKPEGEGVSVTWQMEGENNFMSKAFSVFVNMDEMVGKDFEKGLASMKTAAEAEVKKRAEEAAKVAAEKAAAEKAAAEAAAAAAAAAAPAEGSTAAAPAP
ncbi:SRPBCC family protein [Hyalangium rubrum]|uniref:SRPBCC family protein n=1 Tax=Hyalangium rubrum TaxID=3103134 RepID=A0ABU5H7J6_9BACT|nr:SRPBCC family protein [Hyalangium sp. s54d21]MDY7228854.1 SRPBCC family protein [Hyalangium sp. s54d21]